MLNLNELKAVSEALSYQFQELENMLIWDISRRIKTETNGIDNFTQTAEKQMQDLVDLGYDPKKAREMIANTLGKTAEEVDAMIWHFGTVAYEDDHSHYAKVGKELIPFERNGFVLNIIRDTQNRVTGDILNLSGTTGFVDQKGKFYGVDDYYKRTLDKAVFQVSSGAFDVDSVIRRTIKELGNSGVRTINFESGVTRSLEAAVRTNVLTGISQLAGRIALQNAIDMGEDLMEITAHAGARPTHVPWQGRIVSLSGRNGYLSTVDIGYGDVAGFKGANCLHDWYVFFEGISERKYTDKQLEDFASDEPICEFNGKSYSDYEAGQKMRQIERSIRHTKRELVGYDGAEDDEYFTARSIFLKRQRELYDEFAKVSGKEQLPINQLVYNFDRRKAAKASWAYRKVENTATKLYNTGNKELDIKKYQDYKKQPFLQEQLQYTVKKPLLKGYNINTLDKGFIPKDAVIKNAKTIYKADEINIVNSLVEKYKMPKEAWEKKVGKVESDKFIFDVHWYENGHKQYDMKLKHKGEKK